MSGAVDPIAELGAWIEEARAAGLAQPGSVAFVTADGDGRPSARTVNLKRIEDGALIFTSALWTRKAREIEANPQVALLFHWPSLGRQVHVEGIASLAELDLADQLFAERDRLHQIQTTISRQGEPIESLEPLREELARREADGIAPERPHEWGALRIAPDAIELWSEANDRLHQRRRFERDGNDWRLQLLAP